MIKLTYRPAAGEPSGRLALVGKGIMYDSGGISLKPADEVHAQMKNDMSGAGAVLAAMSALAELGCRRRSPGYLMCTDNMPSGTALALGDVITIRGGTTVEVINTDAEGRLVMADAPRAGHRGADRRHRRHRHAHRRRACAPSAPQVAGVIGNDQGLVDQVRRRGRRPPTSRCGSCRSTQRYRKELDSDVADLSNLGGANAGAITAALFLAEFVGDVPWAHIDIAGTAQSDGDARLADRRAAPASAPGCSSSWRVDFTAPAPDSDRDETGRRPRRADGRPAEEPQARRRAADARRDRAGRQQGPAPGDHLPRPVRARDRAVGGPRRLRRQRHLRRRRAAARRWPRRSTSAGRWCPSRCIAARASYYDDDFEIAPGDHRDREPAQHATASGSSSRRSSTTSPASASSPSSSSP